MTEILMKQQGLMLVCLDCGFSARILPREVPVGKCEYCRKEFGWCLFPDTFLLTHGNGEEVLQDGDMLIINGKLPVTSHRRIYEIRRNGLVIYTDAMDGVNRVAIQAKKKQLGWNYDHDGSKIC